MQTKSTTLGKIGAALLTAQRSIQVITKNQFNPFHKKNYADITAVNEECVPKLNEVGIVVIAPILKLDDGEYIETCLLHAESGEYINSLTKIIAKEQNNPQAYGAAITYARRYGLVSLLNLSVEDDDGNTASGKTTPQPAPVVPIAPPAPVVDFEKRERDYIDTIKKIKTLEGLGEFKAATPKDHWTNKMVVFAKQIHGDIVAGNIKPEEVTSTVPHETSAPEAIKEQNKNLPVTLIDENVKKIIEALKTCTLEELEVHKKTLPAACWKIPEILNAAVERKNQLECAVNDEDLGM